MVARSWNVATESAPQFTEILRAAVLTMTSHRCNVMQVLDIQFTAQSTEPMTILSPLLPGFYYLDKRVEPLQVAATYNLLK